MNNIEKNKKLRIKHYNRYAKFRNKAKKKDTDICSATGIAPQTMWSWSKGEYEPKADKKLLIAKVLGVSLDELMGVKP